MNPILSWLLDLGPLRPGQTGVEFEFARPLPVWAWALIAAAACVFAWRSYTRLEGARLARFTMGLLRATLLVLVLVLISGPRLVKPNEIEERDWVLVLVDRSASMTIRDAPPVPVDAPTSSSPDSPNPPDGAGASNDASGPSGVSGVVATGANEAGESRISREDQLRRVLEAAAPALNDLASERVVVWFGFDSSAYELAMGRPQTPAGEGGTANTPNNLATPATPKTRGELAVNLGSPVGTRTDLERALDQALQKAAARPISGVVVLSDGRSISEPSRAVLRRLEAERIPVFPVALGDPSGLSDVGIRRTEAARVAFANDSVPVEVELERTAPNAGGFANGPNGSNANATEVELVDLATGEVVDRQRVEWSETTGAPGSRWNSDGRGSDNAAPTAIDTNAGDGSTIEERRTVRLVYKARNAGNTRLSARIKPAANFDAGSIDLVESNNAAEINVELVDRPLRVLYVDGYPRWEYRYLKNLLVREPSLSSAVLLLSPRRKYLQEGTVVLDALPRSPEEWANFDVVVLGDVWPGVFTSEQLLQLRERVATSGTGLIWIAGEGSTPGAWATTPLADLLPVRMVSGTSGEDGTTRVPTFDDPVMMRATPAADRLGVLQLADDVRGASRWPTVLADPSAAWAHLQWAQRLEPGLIKPTAEVLAEAVAIAPKRGTAGVGAGESGGSSAGASSPRDAVTGSPLVLSMRYGSGRVIYVATDEVWRWRFARGEPLTERFYIQLLRLLGRESLSRSGKPALLEVQPERSIVQTPVRVRVTLLEQSLVDAAPASIRVRIAPALRTGASSSSSRAAASPSPGSVSDDDSIELSLTRVSGAAGSSGTPRGGRTSAPSSASSPIDQSHEYVATWIPSSAGTYTVKSNDPLLASRSAELSARAEVWQQDDELRRPQTDHPMLESLAKATGGRVLQEGELTRLASFLPNRRVRTSGQPEVDPLWDTPAALIAVVLLLSLEWIGRRMLRLA